LVSISLCMIVKNEEAVIARCLTSVRALVDEIVVVDTGSSDRTKEIVRTFTDRVYDFPWIDDFAAARNASFAYASKDFVMWLDADDVLRGEDAEAFAHLKEGLSLQVDAVSMRYNLAFDEAGHVTFFSRRERLVRRERGFRWVGAVHEYLEVGGNIVHSDVAVTHRPPPQDPDPDRNLRIYEARVRRGEALGPRDLYYFANECLDRGMYERAADLYRRFLDTGDCWIEDAIAAHGKLADCLARLGRADEALASTLNTFALDVPRPETCCRLGWYWMERSEWRRAIFWYRLAATLEPPAQPWSFTRTDMSTWLPHIQLCVCYDRLGEYRLAYEHNEMARSFRPSDPQVLHNKRYLETVRSQGPRAGEAATSA